MALDPKPISGTSPLAAWMERIRWALKGAKLLPGRGYRVKYTTNGTQIELDPITGGGRISGSSIGQYAIVALTNADYLTCVSFSNGALGATQIKIAKDPQFWHRASEIIDGVTVNYPAVNWVDDNHRTANDGTNSEAQVVHPRYVVYDAVNQPANGLLIAGSVNGGSNLPGGASLVELRPSRVWAKPFGS